MCVCVCVREREGERERLGGCWEQSRTCVSSVARWGTRGTHAPACLPTTATATTMPAHMQHTYTQGEAGTARTDTRPERTRAHAHTHPTPTVVMTQYTAQYHL